MNSEFNTPPLYGKSPRLTQEMAARIKQRLAIGIAQHNIAAEFGINQGRVSEVKTGRRFAEVKPQSDDAELG